MRSYWLAALFLAGGAAYAHHSYAGTYSLDRESVLHGKIVKVLLRNPHSYLEVEAPDENGQMQEWSLDWAPAGQLGARGFRRDTLNAGDEVSITMWPVRRAADHRGLVKILRRPSDGFEWGTRPGESAQEWTAPVGRPEVIR